MPSRKRFKCLHCRELQTCDPRNRERQRYCRKAECRKASKAASQRRWAGKAENANYFRGSDHVERVRRWRAAHPGYWHRGKPRQQDALQETFGGQSVGGKEDEAKSVAVALQDVFSSQTPLMVGLISALTGHALQEDIVATARGFESRGRDILRTGCWMPADNKHESQAHFVRPPTAACAATI